MRLTCRAGLWALVLLTTPAIACAQNAGSFSDTLLGDWGGWRSDLLNNGFKFQLGYVSETASNVQGGRQVGVRYTDQFTFGTTLDLEKLIGLKDAILQATVTDRNGRSLSSDENLGSLQEVQEVYGRGQTWRLTQLWYDQTYFGKVFDWKIGRLTVGEDFAGFSCDFMNLTFCGSQPGNLAGSYWFNWPVSQWATRVKATIPNLGYVQLGAYAVNPSWLDRQYAFYLGNPSGTTGALIPLELGWQPRFGAAHLPDIYKFGVWYNTAQVPDVFENVKGQPLAVYGGPPRERDGAYGAYVNFYQKLTSPSLIHPAVGAGAFFNATITDHRTAVTNSQVVAGIKYQGPIASRPEDDVAIAFGRTAVNGRVAEGEELQNAAGLGPVAVQSGSEYASEVYYTIHATNGLDIRPNLQYVHQPGGISQTDDVILGMKISASL